MTVTFGATTGHTNGDIWTAATIVALDDAATLASIHVSKEGALADDKGTLKISVNDGNDGQAPSKTVFSAHANGDATIYQKCYNSDGANGLITIRDVNGTILNT